MNTINCQTTRWIFIKFVTKVLLYQWWRLKTYICVATNFRSSTDNLVATRGIINKHGVLTYAELLYIKKVNKMKLWNCKSHLVSDAGKTLSIDTPIIDFLPTHFYVGMFLLSTGKCFKPGEPAGLHSLSSWPTLVLSTCALRRLVAKVWENNLYIFTHFT